MVERAVNELEKQVEDIAKKSSNVNLDNSVAQVSMLGANELPKFKLIIYLCMLFFFFFIFCDIGS